MHRLRSGRNPGWVETRLVPCHVGTCYTCPMSRDKQKKNVHRTVLSVPRRLACLSFVRRCGEGRAWTAGRVTTGGRSGRQVVSLWSFPRSHINPDTYLSSLLVSLRCRSRRLRPSPHCSPPLCVSIPAFTYVPIVFINYINLREREKKDSIRIPQVSQVIF